MTSHVLLVEDNFLANASGAILTVTPQENQTDVIITHAL